MSYNKAYKVVNCQIHDLFMYYIKDGALNGKATLHAGH